MDDVVYVFKLCTPMHIIPMRVFIAGVFSKSKLVYSTQTFDYFTIAVFCLVCQILPISINFSIIFLGNIFNSLFIYNFERQHEAKSTWSFGSVKGIYSSIIELYGWILKFLKLIQSVISSDFYLWKTYPLVSKNFRA